MKTNSPTSASDKHAGRKRTKPGRALGLAAALSLCCCVFGAGQAVSGENTASPVRLLIVTGGHDFETNQFYRMFDKMTGIVYRAASHPRAHAWFDAQHAGEYDVIVLYDLWQNIDTTACAGFVARLKEGKGLVVLHHALANYQRWPEYERILGGRYYLEKTSAGGVEKAQSKYLHDVRFNVRVINGDHAITRGVTNFEIRDETYNLFDVAPGVDRLLATDEATSGPVIGWAKTYERARVAYIQLGHDHFAYENPSYKRLVTQAIRWSASR